LDTELRAKNKIQATGALAVPVLRVLELLIDTKKNCETWIGKTRKLLTIHGQHHPRADVDRLFVSSEYGGKGLIQLEEAYVIEITKLMEYVGSTEDPLIQIVRTHQNNNKSAMVPTARSLKTYLQKGTRQIKDSITEKAKGRWRAKRMRGQFPRSLDEKPVDSEQSYQWLKFGNIKGETESTIVAALDHAINTNYFKNKFLKEEVNSKCRLCKGHEETIDHLTSGSPILAKNVYLMRHDKVGAHLITQYAKQQA
jgi:hypothetical protein